LLGRRFLAARVAAAACCGLATLAITIDVAIPHAASAALRAAPSRSKGLHILAPGHAAIAASPVQTSGGQQGAGGRCWTRRDSISYKLGNVRFMTYTEEVHWCGNGKKISSQSHHIRGSVTGSGNAAGWQYNARAIIDSSGPVTTASEGVLIEGWAYQTFSQGTFNQCYFHRWCLNGQEGPRISHILYADGRSEFYAAG
jgi:hypothetical protein